MSLNLAILVVTVLFVTGSHSSCSRHCTEPVGQNKPSVPTGNSWYFDHNSKECLSIKGQYFEKSGNRFMNKVICEITCMGCKSPWRSNYNLRQEARAGNCPVVTTTHDTEFGEHNCASDDDCEDTAQKCCNDGSQFKSCLNAVVSLNRIQSNMIYKEPVQPRPRAHWDQNDQHDDSKNGNAFAYANYGQKINRGQINSLERYKGIDDGRLHEFYTENDYGKSWGWDHDSEEHHMNSDEYFVAHKSSKNDAWRD